MALVEAFLKAGAAVITTGRDSKKVQIRKCKFIEVDFTSEKSVNDFLKQIAKEKIDILINNAGINKIALTGDVSMKDWDEVQQVNVRVPMLLCKTLAPQMAKRGFGRILNISSVFGVVSKSKRVSYSTSKSALNGLTRAVALDYAAHGVLVNALAPGFIDTDLTRKILSKKDIEHMVSLVPMGRLGTPEEIAASSLFLASPLNSFITGQVIVADGGFTIA
jgi:3-oxoacyl-[acyl-carrier protein] reductase